MSKDRRDMSLRCIARSGPAANRKRISRNMRLARAFWGITILAAAMHAQTGLTTLANLRDQARPLLIFAARPDDPQLIIQLRTLQDHAAEAQERQITPLAIIYNNPSPTDAKLTPTDAEATRRRFSIAPNEFVVILVGKDGGEKLRSSKPISMAKLDETVDSMPMRQDEVKRNKLNK